LIGLRQKYLKLSFANTVDLTKVKRDIMRVVRVNKEREKSNTYYTDMLATTLQPNEQENSKQTLDHMDNIRDIR
jgi:DNA polymerase epsilon subunit 1